MSADGFAEGRAAGGPDRFANARWPVPGDRPLSVLIPVYRHDAAALVAALGACDRAAEVELVVYDDGSGESGLTVSLRDAVEAFPGAALLLTSARNRGRSAGRNILAGAARSDWLLMLDADMKPDAQDFLARWIEEAQRSGEPRAVFGGFSLAASSNAPAFALHRAQSEASECLCATDRSREPGKYVFTSNLLIHREVLAAVAFDEGYQGWGWEDVDWGLRVADDYDVRHIDNTASHLGLDTDAALIAKYAASGANFVRLAARHPEAVAHFPVFRAARALKPWPFKRALETASLSLARSAAAPLGLRLLGLKLGRAAIYARALSGGGTR